jgi:hypothetical protein
MGFKYFRYDGGVNGYVESNNPNSGDFEMDSGVVPSALPIASETVYLGKRDLEKIINPSVNSKKQTPLPEKRIEEQPFLETMAKYYGFESVDQLKKIL